MVLVSKEDMEKLRQALKTLSEAEKQLRTSNDKLTWLTAALLQLAPDQQYMLPSSSADTSFNQSPLPLNNNVGGRNVVRRAGEQDRMLNNERGLSTDARQAGTSDLYSNGLMKDSGLDRKRHNGSAMYPQQTSVRSTDSIRANGRQVSGKSHKGIEEIWLEVLDNIQYIGIKEFLSQEGKLISVSFGAGTISLRYPAFHTPL